MVRTIGVTLLIILSAIPAVAQTERGGIRGTVTDATQAVIPGVTVTATNVETGVFRSTETTGEGIYNLAALPGGTYRVEVIHPGMRTEVRENVRVTAASVTSLSFTLEVGAAQESVVVTAETLLQADTSTDRRLVGHDSVCRSATDVGRQPASESLHAARTRTRWKPDRLHRQHRRRPGKHQRDSVGRGLDGHSGNPW